jgi:hypothetical protein
MIIAVSGTKRKGHPLDRGVVHIVETQHETVDRIHLAWNRVQWRASENRIMKLVVG